MNSIKRIFVHRNVVIIHVKDTLDQIKYDLVIVSEHEQACILKERLRMHSEMKSAKMQTPGSQFGKRRGYKFY
jgi:hypothetical protein